MIIKRATNTTTHKGGRVKRTKRTYTKRRNLTAGVVARIAKRVVSKTAETKSYYQGFNTSMTDNTYYAACLNYGISQQVGSQNALGEKIQLKNVRIKGWMYQTSTGGASLVQRMGRISLIWCKKNLATAALASITRSDIMRTGTSTNNFVPADHLDLHKVKVCYDQVFNFPLQNSTDNWTNHLIDINVPINQTKYFQQDTLGYFKDYDLYLVTAVYTNGGITTPGSILCNVAINFKDE